MTAKADFVDNNTPTPDIVNAAWLNEVATKANGSLILGTTTGTAYDGALGAAAATKANTATQPADVAAAQLVAISAQSANYTLAIGDANKVVEFTKSTAGTVTVPPNSSVAFPVGTTVEIAQTGAGQVTVVAGAGVTINYPSSLTTRAQWSMLAVRKRATDTWLLSGDAS